jgi:nucleoside-diphosphate-sugar epimerase
MVDHLVNLARPPEPPLGSPSAHHLSTEAHTNGLALLMTHCSQLASVLHCSSTSMYSRDHLPASEDDAITDDRHPRRPTYTLAKIGAEAAMSALSVAMRVPATIARLNVPYSDRGGWPAAHLRALIAGVAIELHPRRPNAYNPIHTDDMARHVVPLLDAARSPVTLVNWAGFETVSIEEWSTYLGSLVGRTPTFVEFSSATEAVTVDTSRLRDIAGDEHLPWRDGMRRLAMTIAGR